MKRKLGWLALAVALAAPATMAWADSKAPSGDKTDGHSCCCFCDKSCPK
ncbi:MAG TPA: hypothetical protein VOA87_06340 [Thermoanaerobaculia bacterium]|nr:hypothetical protein [Thermoanaerobaculia bacterium]